MSDVCDTCVTLANANILLPSGEKVYVGTKATHIELIENTFIILHYPHKVRLFSYDGGETKEFIAKKCKVQDNLVTVIFYGSNVYCQLFDKGKVFNCSLDDKSIIKYGPNLNGPGIDLSKLLIKPDDNQWWVLDLQYNCSFIHGVESHPGHYNNDTGEITYINTKGEKATTVKYTTKLRQPIKMNNGIVKMHYYEILDDREEVCKGTMIEHNGKFTIIKMVDFSFLNFKSCLYIENCQGDKLLLNEQLCEKQYDYIRVIDLTLGFMLAVTFKGKSYICHLNGKVEQSHIEIKPTTCINTLITKDGDYTRDVVIYDDPNEACTTELGNSTSSCIII